MHYNNESLHNLHDIADMFASYFESVFTHDDVAIINYSDVCSSEFNNIIHLHSCSVTEKTILTKLNALNNSLSIDPDGLPHYFLKKMCFQLM